MHVNHLVALVMKFMVVVFKGWCNIIDGYVVCSGHGGSYIGMVAICREYDGDDNEQLSVVMMVLRMV